MESGARRVSHKIRCADPAERASWTWRRGRSAGEHADAEAVETERESRQHGGMADAV